MPEIKEYLIYASFNFDYYLMVIYWIMWRATKENLVGVCWKDNERLTDLDFADDIVLFGESSDDLQNLTTQVKMEAGSVGLIISGEKTKMTTIGK